MADLDQLLAEFLALEGKADRTEDEDAEMYRLKDLVVKRVDLVPRGANGRRFAVVKTGDAMPDTDPNLGAEVVDNGDGTLSAVTEPEAAAPETVEKQEMPGPAQEGMLKKLTAVSERLMSLVNRVKGAKPMEGASIPAAFLSEVKALKGLLDGVESSYPSPQVRGTAEKTKKADDAPAETPEITPQQALEAIEKAGAKMKGERLKKLKDHVTGLSELLKDLEGDPQTRALMEMIGALKKSGEANVEAIRAAVAGLPTAIQETFATLLAATVAKSDDTPEPNTKPEAEAEPLSAGQAEPAQPTNVAKGAEPTWGDVCGRDLNEARKTNQ